ncbi:hypothetical protein O9929_10610 [Vibrio lentus]|nr:hypothetical protein [Vibrio lentus]
MIYLLKQWNHGQSVMALKDGGINNQSNYRIDLSSSFVTAEETVSMATIYLQTI